MRAGPTSGQLNGAGSPAAARRLLRARLEERLPEIEVAVLTRVYGIADPTGADPAYVDGLRASVSVALDYALEAIERGEERAPPPPPALLAQARMAARSGVGLDTVLRRYFAGYSLLGDFLADEAEGGGIPQSAILAQLLRGRAAVLDRLLVAVSEEYEREMAARSGSSERRLAERVERLLAGEPIDTSGLAYGLERHHTGVVAAEPSAAEAMRKVAKDLDVQLLLVRREEGVWAWLGARRPLDPEVVRRTLPSTGGQPGAPLALGEPAQGLSGWRLTHRQASAALPVARREGKGAVRYADVALLSSAQQDDLLATSLRRLYLEPLQRQRDGGETARGTLRAYFEADRNASSAAAALGVNRNTIAERLRAIEAAIGRPLASCEPELAVALRLTRLDEHVLP